MQTAIVTDAGLTLDQEYFAQAFVAANGNGSEAYRRTHPDSLNWLPESVNVAASRLMAQDKIALRIREIAKEALAAAMVTPDWIVGRLKTEATGGDLAEPNHARIESLKTLAKIRRLLDDHVIVQDDQIARRVLERLDAAMSRDVASRGGDRWSTETPSSRSLLPATDTAAPSPNGTDTVA